MTHNTTLSADALLRRRFVGLGAAGVLAAGLLFPSITRAAPPVADVAPFSTSEYGTPVTDDYRWMETPDSGPLASWMHSQNDFTRATLELHAGPRRSAQEGFRCREALRISPNLS